MAFLVKAGNGKLDPDLEIIQGLDYGNVCREMPEYYCRFQTWKTWSWSSLWKIFGNRLELGVLDRSLWSVLGIMSEVISGNDVWGQSGE